MSLRSQIFLIKSAIEVWLILFLLLRKVFPSLFLHRLTYTLKINTNPFFNGLFYLCFGEKFLSSSIYNFYVYLIKININEIARLTAAFAVSCLKFESRSQIFLIKSAIEVWLILFLLLPKSISLSFFHTKKDKNRCPCPFLLYFLFTSCYMDGYNPII